MDAHVEPVVVVEVAVRVGRHRASEVFACVVDVRGGVDYPQRGGREGRVGRRENRKVLRAAKVSRDEPIGARVGGRTSLVKSTPGLLFHTIISRMNGYLAICLKTNSSPLLRFQCNTTAVTPTTGEPSPLSAERVNRVCE